jgi:hypothetical protein
MEQEHVAYLAARYEQEMAAAAAAANKVARVAHYELAYRYSLAMAHTSGPTNVSGGSAVSVLPAETVPVSCTTSAVPT